MKKTTLRKAALLSLLLSVLMTAKGFSQTQSQTFNANQTFQIPPGVTQITVEAWGGGGRGGSRTSSGTAFGGGGGGAYAKKLINVTPGTTYNVVIGAGSNNNTQPGGTSYFNTAATISAVGGASVPNNSTVGGSGGSSALCIGDIAYSGGNGYLGSGANGGGGGSGADSNGNGVSATSINGAIASLDGGTGGAGRNGNGNGFQGTAPGGGGGGSARTSGNPTGGNGSAGRIVITYPTPEIDIFGNNVAIGDGDTATSLLNLTDFGTTSETVGTITRSFIIQNTATTPTLTVGAITISGTNAADFKVTRTPSATVTAGSFTTFEVTFNPSAMGIRTATISIVNNDSNENPYNFVIQGTGTSFNTQSHTLYFETFDNSNGGWTPSTTSWVYDNTIHRGEGRFWRTVSPYTNNLMIYLTSPAISTAGYKNIRVTFDTRYDTSSDNDDGMQIQYSLNNGANWNILGTNTENWYTATNVSALNASVGSSLGWNGESATSAMVAPYSNFTEKSMQSTVLDNSSQPILFRVVFASDGSTTDTGVAFDNFTVKGDPITPVDPTAGPGSVNDNLKLWLKSTSIPSMTDGSAVGTWNDNAFDNNAIGLTSNSPTYRDNPTRNINFNPVVDFSAAGGNVMKGKGGYWAQDYYIVVKTNANIDNSAAARQVPISGRTAITAFHLDGTAFAFGNFTARYSNEIISHSINSIPQTPPTNCYGRAYTSATDSFAPEIMIYNIKTNAAGTSTEIYKNGKKIDNTGGQAVAADQVTFTGLLNFSEFSNLQYNLGVGRFSLNGNIGSFLDGRITEIISYSNPKTTVEKKKIESYLAIKNGITLHDSNSATANNLGDTDYVDSNGGIIWNSATNNGYNYDIAGIGRDDNTGLNQKQSKSENNGSIITVGLGDINGTNSANTHTFATDKSYLVWGSNGATMANSNTPIPVDLGPTTITTFTEVVNRRWKIVETGGDVGITRVSVPTSAFVSGLPVLGANDAYVMVVATNAAFTTGIETVFMTTSGSDQTLVYDFDGTKYFTFGVAHRSTNPLHITLDGIDDFVRIDDVNELGNTFTAMTWIRPNGNNNLGDERTILAKKATSANGYRLVLQTDNKIRMEWSVSGTTYQAVTNTAIPDAIWHNIAVTYSSGSLKIYIDGILDIDENISVDPVPTTSLFSIGAQYVDKNNILNLFKGDLDELRMWSRVLTETEIRFIMNQEILQDGSVTQGTIIPNSIPKNDVSSLNWNNLFAYYSMNTYIGTHLDDDSYNNNRGSLVIPDKISIKIQDAPMPYLSTANGNWDMPGTWVNGNKQEVPYSISIVDPLKKIAWNIVKTAHAISSNGNQILLGLFVDSNKITANNNSKVEVSHYLKLDGKIDLQDKSQLIQTENSFLDPTSAGSIERDQQGTNNIFNYNYWASPVSAINAVSNNAAFTIANVFKDGTDPANIKNINWLAGYDGNSSTSPIALADWWIYKFQNVGNDYANWEFIGSAGSLLPGEGFTLKGSGTSNPTQNYTFVGKPNNGTITIPIGPTFLNLSGNPYPSALDSEKFINDNLDSTDGTIYFWEHSSTNNTHNLFDYQGGYSTITLVGGTPPVAPEYIAGVGQSARIPNRFIPVGQGFFLTGNATGGNVVFKNSQRLFIKEDHEASNTMFRNQNITNTSPEEIGGENGDNSNDTPAAGPDYSKIRLGFISANSYHRQILMGFMNENATSSLDPGYDAQLFDDFPNDMYFINGQAKLVIQGEGFFNQTWQYKLGVKTSEEGNVKFLLDDLLNFDSDQQVYIYDAETEIYHSINQEAFEINLPAGLYENRFSLRFTNGVLGMDENIKPDNIEVMFTNKDNLLVINNKNLDIMTKSVMLFNILGQNIQTWDVQNEPQDSIKIPIKNYPTGTYIVKLQTTSGVITKKIIIK